MTQTGSLRLKEIAGGKLGLNSSLQCLMFAKRESNIDTILDEPPASPCHSDSSGVSSLYSSSYWDSDSSSDCKDSICQDLPPVIPYQGRDLLDLGAHLRGSPDSWQPATLPPRDVEFFLLNRSLYDRLTKFGPLKGDPQAFCNVCYLKYGLLNSCCFCH